MQTLFLHNTVQHAQWSSIIACEVGVAPQILTALQNEHADDGEVPAYR